MGATINIMLAAAKAPRGTTTIVNAAKEPHVVDVANFLNCMGAKVKGAGTDIIKCCGAWKSFTAATIAMIPDQIEAGTLMIAAAATRGDVTVQECDPHPYGRAVTAKLLEMGVDGGRGRDDSLRVQLHKAAPRRVSIKTLPYPGFPTDLQQPATALLSSTAERHQRDRRDDF